MKKIFLFFRPFYERYKWPVLLYILLTVLHKTLTFCLPQLLERLIDSAVARNLDGFVRMAVFNLSAFFLFITVLFFRSYTQTIAENEFYGLEARRVFSDMLSTPFAVLKGQSLGHYLHFLESDINRVRGLAFYDVTVLITNLLMAGGMLIYLFRQDRLLAAIVLFTIPFFVTVTRVMMPRLEREQRRVIAQSEQINDCVDACYTGCDSIQAANAQRFFMKRAEAVLQNSLLFQKKLGKKETVYDVLFVTGCMNLVNILIYCVGGYRVIQGALTIGAVNTFALYFGSLWNSLESVMAFLKNYRVSAVSIDRLSAFHRQAGERFEAETPQLPAFETLEISGLCFAYGPRPILRDFDIQIRRGERVLIAGDNGCGKTTLARLMVKLLAPDAGCMKYNGLNYDSLSAGRLRERILLIPSEAFIIDGDFADNLWGGALSEPEPAVFRDRPIEKNGANLSSGQKKWIQLLRGLSADADVYIFDEPFNYLDQAHKQTIWQDILKHFADKTLIVISHDPEPEPDCTRKIVLSPAVPNAAPDLI